MSYTSPEPRRTHEMQSDVAARLCCPDPSELQAAVSTNERIRHWLYQTRASCHGQPDAQGEQSRETSPTPGKQPWRPHGLPIAEVDARMREERRRRDEKPMKLDLLLSVSSSTSGVTAVSSPSAAGRSSAGGKRRRPRSQSQNASTLDRSEDLVFEKRPRRKTRTDKYDTNKRRGHKDLIKKKQASRPRKKMKKGKSGLQSKHDIMNNFVSPAIANPRLITKPNLTTGLFLNGRSSNSRNLTDLSFNDMEFLDHDHDDGTTKEVPKSHSKDHKRKRERELQADADFFEDAAGRHLTASSSQEAEKIPETAQSNTISKEATDQAKASRPPHEDGNESVARRVYPNTSSRNTSTPASRLLDSPEVQPVESRLVNSPGKRLLQNSDKEDKNTTEGETGLITNTDCFAEALRQTGVFDFPGLARDPTSVLPQTQDLASRKVSVPPVAGVEARRRGSSTKAYRDIGIMASQPFDSYQGAQSLYSPRIYDSDRVSLVGYGQDSLGEANSDETGAQGAENENTPYACSGSKAEIPGQQKIIQSCSITDGQKAQTHYIFPDEHLVNQDSPFDGYPGNRPLVQPSRCSILEPRSFNPPWASYHASGMQIRLPTITSGLVGDESMYGCSLENQPSLQPSRDHRSESLLDFIERTEHEVLGNNAFPGTDDDYRNENDRGCVCVDPGDQFEDTDGCGETMDLPHPYGPLNISGPIFRAINISPASQGAKATETEFQNQPVAGQDEIYKSDGLVMAEFWRPNFL